jgi:hypothetical protein
MQRNCTFYMWRAGKCDPRTRFLLAEFTRGGEGGEEVGKNAKQCHSLTDHWINCKLKTKIANTFLLLCYFDKFCPSPSGGLWQASAHLYCERIYKREPEPAASSQSTTLRSTVNISVQEESRTQQPKWNSKPLFFSRLNTAAHGLHFQHLTWTKGYTVDSRRLQ